MNLIINEQSKKEGEGKSEGGREGEKDETKGVYNKKPHPNEGVDSWLDFLHIIFLWLVPLRYSS
jgi:hypothetical protein